MIHVVGYTDGGQIVNDPSHWSCFAKSTYDSDTDTTRYYVKAAVTGPHAGELYSNRSLYYRPGDERRKSEKGQNLYEFRPVSEMCFNYYLSYLKTGSVINLKWAQRSLE